MKKKLLGFLSVLGILSSFTGCGAADSVCGLLPDGGKGDADALTTSAQVCTDRTSLGFAREFGSGTFIGTKPQDTLSIRNGGTNDLTIDSVTLTGDSGLTLNQATVTNGTLASSLTSREFVVAPASGATSFDIVIAADCSDNRMATRKLGLRIIVTLGVNGPTASVAEVPAP